MMTEFFLLLREIRCEATNAFKMEPPSQEEDYRNVLDEITVNPCATNEKESKELQSILREQMSDKNIILSGKV